MSAIVPEELRDKVQTIGSEVHSSDLDNYERLQSIENKRTKLNTLLSAWERQQDEERQLRRGYAKWLIGGLFFQMLLVDITFFSIGFGWLSVEKWVATSFILAVLTDIGALTAIVTKYLFPKPETEVLEQIEKL